MSLSETILSPETSPVKEIKLEDLKTKSPTELLALAEDLSVENASTMRKQELLFAILKQFAGRDVEIIGGGVVGFNAAQMATGLGADVTILDRDPEVLERVGTFFESRAKTRFSNRANLAQCVAEADLVIGAVLIPGAEAPKLVTRDMLKTMRPGSVLVDVAIDQGGCFETSHPTTHDAPTYVVDGIVHYAVANMPGAVARTSTYALNNVTLPHALRIADLGWKEALRRDVHLSHGLNVWNGKVTFEAVAEAVGTDYVPVEQALA